MAWRSPRTACARCGTSRRRDGAADVPDLPMTKRNEREAYVAVGSVLREPDPYRDDVRARFRTGLERDWLDHAARNRTMRGDLPGARALAHEAARMPPSLDSRLAWR